MNAVEAEAVVAGTVLAYPNVAGEIVSNISADMFTRPECASVIRVASKIIQSGHTLSRESIRVGLVQDGFYEKLGGDATMIQLAAVADVSAYESHMFMVSNAWAAKQWASTLKYIAAEAERQGHWNDLRDPLFDRVNAIEAKSALRKVTIDRIKSRIVRADSQYEHLEPVISIDGHRIATVGSLIQVVGEQKAGKSTVMYSMCFATIPGVSDESSFGLHVEKNMLDRMVLFVDTEQTPQEQQESIQTSMYRAGIADMSKHPEHVVCLNMKGIERKELMRSVEVALDEGVKKFGGVYMVFLDSSTDFANKMDYQSSDEGVSWMMGIATRYNAPVLAANHFNPTSSGGEKKSSGHLGSRFGHRVSATINIVKDSDSEISKIYFSDLRRSSKIPPRYFKWDNKRQYSMPISQVEGEAAFAANSNAFSGF